MDGTRTTGRDLFDALEALRPLRIGFHIPVSIPNYFKNLLDATLKIENGDPRAWLYHSKLRLYWARHMVSEGIKENHSNGPAGSKLDKR